MKYCPRCLTEYDDDAKVCWPCRRRLVPADGNEREQRDQPEGLSPIYLAPDEFSALRLQSVLEDAGVRAVVQSSAIPWIAGVPGTINGYWGRVLVHPADREHAEEVVREYLASLRSDP